MQSQLHTTRTSISINPESNGLAEGAIKNQKVIVRRTHAEKANLEEAIAAWRNMARADRISPSQLFFNRLPRQKLPIHADPTPINIDNKSRSRTNALKIANQKYTRPRNAELILGSSGLDTAPRNKEMGQAGKNHRIEIRQDGRSYLLETAYGTHLLRGRRFVKLC